jgi:hypothetical protein
VRLEVLGLEKSSDLIGNGTLDLPACSIVSQPTKLQRRMVGLLMNNELERIWKEAILN